MTSTFCNTHPPQKCHVNVKRVQSCNISAIEYDAESTPKIEFSLCRITFRGNVSCKKSGFSYGKLNVVFTIQFSCRRIKLRWMDLKFLLLNQISYTLPFVLTNRVSFGEFVFVFISVLKFLLWIRQRLFQQLETFLSSCLSGLLFSNCCIFRQDSMLAKELSFNELLVF